MISKDSILLLLANIYMLSAPVFDVIVAFFPKILLDLYINDKSVEYISLFILDYLLLGSFLGLINCVIRQNVAARIGYLRIDYLAEAFNKIITSDYKNMEDSTFFNKYDSAFDACSNTENGIEKVYNILFELPALILKVFFFSCILCTYSPIVLFGVILHAAVSFVLKKKSAYYKYEYREEFSKINRKKRYYNNISQDFQYGKDIRLYGLKDIISEKYYTEVRRYKALFAKIKNKEIILNLFSCVTMIISDIAIYSVLIINSIHGISISNVTMYFIVVNMLMFSINIFIDNISNIYGEGMFIADYFDFINADLCKKYGKSGTFTEGSNPGIRIRNLSFKYPNTDKYVIKNLSLNILPGEKIALVGDNGVGKTTLVKIIVGLFRDFEGEVYIGKNSIKEISIESLFSIFSIVFQDVNLLAYTIAENITGSSNCIDESKVWNVLDRVGLKNRIEENTKGLQQLVHKYIDEEGIEFSGGESQKMAIARAIFKDSDIFVLDEPTACLDALAEKEIYEKFEEIVQGKTTIFISHRLASTKFCDRIILFGREGILEQGTHKALMDLKGRYYELFSLQGKNYREKYDEEA